MTITDLPEKRNYGRFLRRVADAMRTNPDAQIWVPVHFDGYFGHCRTVADVSRECRRALHRRINDRGGELTNRGRRDTPMYYWSLKRDARKVREYRMSRIVWRGSGFETTEARARFPDIQEIMTSRDQ